MASGRSKTKSQTPPIILLVRREDNESREIKTILRRKKIKFEEFPSSEGRSTLYTSKGSFVGVEGVQSFVSLFG